MAKVQIKMPDDFLHKVSRLGERTDEIIKHALEDGGQVVLGKVQSNLAGAVGRNTKHPSRSTGQLQSALGLSPVKKDRDGNSNIKVGFAENRNDGTTNAMLASILEYGKHGQPPKPFLKPARASSRKACIDTMQARLQKEIEKV